MSAERALPIPAQHREFAVTIEGEPVGREHHLMGVYVTKAVNRISAARLVYLDGKPAEGDFPLSNTTTFVPGKTVEILAGPTEQRVPIFKGIVVQQGIKVRDGAAPQLVVECRHKACRLTVGARNAYFFDQTDSDIIGTILDAAEIDANVDATSVTHAQQVQYRASDWDFLLTRAEANGRLVLTNDAGVTVRAPRVDGEPLFSLQFGATLLELDCEIDARSQYAAVKGITWDPAQQEVREVQASEPGVSEPGNLQSSELASVVAAPSYDLRHAALAHDEAQAWADAQWLKSRLSKVSGRAKCEGIAGVNPGDIVALAGVGDRFSGTIFVTGVRQDFDVMQGWKTHVQFGSVDEWTAQRLEISAPRAAALLPAVSGLQIGKVVSNEDPAGEHRVRVCLPLVDAQADGVWARVASPDAGAGRGMFFRPEVGDEVVLGFLEDDPRRAVILGMLHSSAKAPPLQGSDDNHEKVYRSRSGMRLYFNDDTKVVMLETPAGNLLSLNEENQSVKLKDQNSNLIELHREGIRITSVGKIEISAPRGLELLSDGLTRIKGSQVQIN